MLFAIINDSMEKALTELRDRISSIHTPEDKIKQIIHSHIKFYADHREQTKVTIHERKALEGDYAKTAMGKEEQYVTSMRNVLKEIIENFGVEIDVNIATFCLLGMLNWMIHWYNPKGNISPEKLAESISTIFLNGLKGKPS